MRSITLFFETKQGKYIKNLIIGMGASVVLLGALFKIQHWPFAGVMLTAGMLTEAFIFALLGILPPHKDYYWERFYPNIDESPEIEAYRTNKKVKASGSLPGESPIKSMDKMLEEAEITPASLRRLAENFGKLGTTVEQMKDITDVTAATGEFSNSAREAAGSMGQLKSTFEGAYNTMASFNNAADDTAKYHQQVQVLSKNLGALNQIYEVELQDANNHLKAMNKFYGNLVNASDAMAASATDAVAAKEQIGALAKNLSSLNSIYGNMLSAMQGR